MPHYLNVNNRNDWNLLAWAIAAYYNITPHARVPPKHEYSTLYRRFLVANRKRWKYTLTAVNATQQRVKAGIQSGVYSPNTCVDVAIDNARRAEYNDMFREVKWYLKPTGMLPEAGGMFTHPDITARYTPNDVVDFREIRWIGIDYGSRHSQYASILHFGQWKDKSHYDYKTGKQRAALPYASFVDEALRPSYFGHSYDEAIIVNGAVIGYCPTYVLRVGEDFMVYRLAFYTIEKD